MPIARLVAHMAGALSAGGVPRRARIRFVANQSGDGPGNGIQRPERRRGETARHIRHTCAVDDPDTHETTSVRSLDGVRVEITVRQGVLVPLPRARLVRAIVAALRAGHAPRPASVSLILTDDTEITVLNERHMGHEGPTDVLSFPMLSPGAFPAHPGQDPAVRAADVPAFPLPPGARTHIGDIVVSVQRAIEQAEQGRGGQTGDRRWSPADELRLLVTHGALHLCGWDHALPAEEAAMRALERELLDTLT